MLCRDIVKVLSAKCDLSEEEVVIIILTLIIANIIINIIIITRPMPAYGWQGLARSLGQDTDQAGTFWGVINVSLCASGAQLGFKPTW